MTFTLWPKKECPNCNYIEGRSEVLGTGFGLWMTLLVIITISFFFPLLLFVAITMSIWIYLIKPCIYFLIPTKQTCPKCYYKHPIWTYVYPKGKVIYYGAHIIIGLIPLLLGYICLFTVLHPDTDIAYQRSIVQSQQKQIGLALIMYSNENDERFPDKLSELYPEYVSEIKIFFNYRRDKSKIIKPENIDSLGLFEYLGAGLTQQAAPNTVLAREKHKYTKHWKKNWNNYLEKHWRKYWEKPGRNELFLDGHSEWVPMKE